MRRLLLTVPALLFVAATAAAGPIQPYYNGGTTILPLSPVGQSFIAESTTIDTIAIQAADMNPVFNPTDFTLTFELYEGDGFSGTLLGTATTPSLAPLAGISGIATASFGGIPLTIGNTYTFIVSDSTPRWGYRGLFFSAPVGYAGGHAYVNGVVRDDVDLTFFIDDANPQAEPFVPPPPPAPEPTSLALFGIAMLGAGYRRFAHHR